MLKLKLILFCCIIQMNVSQAQLNLDSLKMVLAKAPADSSTLRKYLHYIDTLSTDQSEVITTIGLWIIKHAEKKGFENILAKTHLVTGRTYAVLENLPQTVTHLTKAIALAEKNDFYEIEINALINLHNILKITGNNDKAMESLLKAKKLSEQYNYTKGIATTKYYQAIIMGDVGFPGSKDTFHLKMKLIKEAIQEWVILKDTPQINIAYVGLCERYGGYGYYDSAINTMMTIKPFFSLPQNKKYLPSYYFIMGKTYYQKARNNNNDLKDLKEAVVNFNLCIPIAKQFNNTKYLMRSYDWAAYAYELMGDFKNAFYYARDYTNIADSIGSEDNFKAMADIQNKYERERKDNEIVKLDAANKQKNTINKILIGSACTLLLIGFLGYRNFKNRQQLQQAKIAELEKDKQLMAVDAMLKGQETERSRIAKDLHDGLGGMLSGTKLSFMNTKENLVLTPENAAQFDKSLGLLDSAIADLRKVAHNLMPEALVKFGLNEAARDFCDTIKDSSGINIVYQYLGVERKLEASAEVFTYRILQELVNNAVKHAGASQIFVQLTMDANKLFITVEDDGKGFSMNDAVNSKGAGLSNIKYRVQYLNGTIDIITDPGNSTSVNIELKA